MGGGSCHGHNNQSGAESLLNKIENFPGFSEPHLTVLTSAEHWQETHFELTLTDQSGIGGTGT